jgi:lysophospholipase L1-like esterase
VNRTLTAAALAALVVAAPVARAQEVVNSAFIAFGDSITRGGNEFDEENRGGYPGRLQSRLRQTDPDAVVYNYGRDGEVTAEGLSRLDNVLHSVQADALLLMEGTNDVNYVVDGLISFESIGNNLAAMGNRASNVGLDVYFGTLWPRPPQATKDHSNVLTFAMARVIRDLAFRQQRDLVDPFDTVYYTPGAFQQLYDKDSLSGVGHPNAAGFDLLARTFFDVVRDVDSQGLVPGDLLPGYSVDSLAPGDHIELTVYDFGAGIDETTTSLAINGVAVLTDQAGSERRRLLTHDATAESLGCYARVGIVGSDVADPANATNHIVKEFRVEGGHLLLGDFDKSCRVDGEDLLLLTFSFGAREGEARYSRLADLDANGVINGHDLALLAANFGRSS